MILESGKANTLNRTTSCFNIKRNKIAGGQKFVRSSIILHGLNDFVSELIDKLSAGLEKISTVASSSPYTMTLAAPVSLLKAQITATQSAWYDANAEFFPTTKSEIVTLD